MRAHVGWAAVFVLFVAKTWLGRDLRLCCRALITLKQRVHNPVERIGSLLDMRSNPSASAVPNIVILRPVKRRRDSWCVDDIEPWRNLRSSRSESAPVDRVLRNAMAKKSRLRRPSFPIVFGEADPPAHPDFQRFVKYVIGSGAGKHGRSRRTSNFVWVFGRSRAVQLRDGRVIIRSAVFPVLRTRRCPRK